MADDEAPTHESKQVLIFTYGTLKRGFPNCNLVQDLISQNDAAFLGTYVTHQAYPLVIGPHGIPFLINLPGAGHRVKGELYSVSARGLVRVDELEGTSRGHYERLPIKVMKWSESESGGDGDGVVLFDAEAYYGNRSFGEGLWEKRGRVGLSEYSEVDSQGYVKREDRPGGTMSFIGDIQQLLSNS